MDVLARDLKLADWPLRLYEHAGGREWSTDDHGDLWKHKGSVEVVPASQLAGAVAEVELLREWIDSYGRGAPSNTSVDGILERSRNRVPPPTGGQ